MSANELEHASQLLREGKFLDAAALCGAVLRREPRNAIAAHVLGLALKDSGDLAEGARWIRHSIALDPTQPDFHANLANLQRKRKRPLKAIATYERALELSPRHHSARHNLALTLADVGRFAEANRHSEVLLAERDKDPESWILAGLIRTGLRELAGAEAAYRRAIDLDPANVEAHNNLGALLTLMTKPEAATAVLERARSLGPQTFEIAFNRGRAFLENNEVELAEAEFERSAELRPDDLEAQFVLAKVRHMRGDRMFARSLARAAAANRNDLETQLLFGQLLWRSGEHSGAEAIMHDLLRRHGPHPNVHATLAGILLEQNRLIDAESHALDAITLAPGNGVIMETNVSILLARGRASDALPFIVLERQRSPLQQAWIAYEATAKRALGDASYRELYDYERFARIYDLDPPRGWRTIGEFNRDLSAILNDRHRFNHHPLDQTVRNGTQTARSLLLDENPLIRSILEIFAAAVADYQGSLGQHATHPLLARNKGAAGFTGAWSVQLSREGFHVNHFHPDGWLSSAYYVDVPAETDNQQLKSGWLKFGEPRYKVPGCSAEYFVQPAGGRLVLFPSYMWHGTNPIHGAEPRLTIAFDARP